MRNGNVCILVILFFIFGSTLTLFFMTLDEDDGSKGYKIDSAKLGHSVYYGNISSRYFLVILIITNPNNLSKRNAIRETWLQFIKDDKSVKHLFVIGAQDLSFDKLDELNKEHKKHGDLVIFSKVKESYKILTKKVLASFVYIKRHFNFKFALKCDDDSFVNVVDVVKELKTRFQDNNLLYWGFFDGRAHVKKVGKWKEKNWILCDRYLPYALGGGYILSSQLVKFISMNAEFLSLYNSEDVSVGVWLSPLNISRIHDQRFDTEYISRGCSNAYLVTHKKSEKEMRHLYSETVTHGRMCSVEEQLKPSYVYNWNAIPSRCCIRNGTIT